MRLYSTDSDRDAEMTNERYRDHMKLENFFEENKDLLGRLPDKLQLGNLKTEYYKDLKDLKVRQAYLDREVLKEGGQKLKPEDWVVIGKVETEERTEIVVTQSRIWDPMVFIGNISKNGLVLEDEPVARTLSAYQASVGVMEDLARGRWTADGMRENRPGESELKMWFTRLKMMNTKYGLAYWECLVRNSLEVVEGNQAVN